MESQPSPDVSTMQRPHFVHALSERLRVLFREARKKLAALIAPPGEPFDQEWDVRINLCLHCAKELRRHLTLDEDTYLFVAGAAWANACEYVIYTALDEVKRTALYLMRLQEMFHGPAVDPRANRINRLMVTQILEEIHTRERRLLEVLVTLVNFSVLENPEYYRHLLVLEELDSLLSSARDAEDFYGIRNANIEDSIAKNLAHIEQIESGLDLRKAWYRRDSRPLGPRAKLAPGRMMSSFRARLQIALPHLTNSEKLVSGFTYAMGYGRASESMHYRPDSGDFMLRSGQDRTAGLNLAPLAFAVLDRCHQILGRPESPGMCQLRATIDEANSIKAIVEFGLGTTSVGDFVLHGGALCEVTLVQDGPYGYRSVRIHYLVERLKPEIEEDWLPAFTVKPFYTRAMVRGHFRDSVARGELPHEFQMHLETLDDDALQPYLRTTIVHLWSSGGLREWVRNEQSLASARIVGVGGNSTRTAEQ